MKDKFKEIVGLTVEKLIEELQKFPKDAIIVINSNYPDGDCSAEKIAEKVTRYCKDVVIE